MDWMTLLIELVGLAVLIVFVVIPVREFRGILAALRRRGDDPAAAATQPPESGERR